MSGDISDTQTPRGTENRGDSSSFQCPSSQWHAGMKIPEVNGEQPLVPGFVHEDASPLGRNTQGIEFSFGKEGLQDSILPGIKELP